jgi:hypothetical protein
MRILIKFPTRGRPEKFMKALDKYIDLAVQKDKISFLVSMDEDDTTATPEFIKIVQSKHPNIQLCVGTSNGKIHAVNRDMEKAPPYDILVLASDDMIPQCQAYDDTIRNTMALHFSDTDGVLWFNDGIREKELNTLCILGKKYYDRFGYIYYPGYKSFYCDNEFTDVATKLNKMIYFDLVIIRHEHMVRDNSLDDDTYRKNSIFGDIDRELYESRKNAKVNHTKLGFIKRAFSTLKKTNGS